MQTLLWFSAVKVSALTPAVSIVVLQSFPCRVDQVEPDEALADDGGHVTDERGPDGDRRPDVDAGDHTVGRVAGGRGGHAGLGRDVTGEVVDLEAGVVGAQDERLRRVGGVDPDGGVLGGGVGAGHRRRLARGGGVAGGLGGRGRVEEGSGGHDEREAQRGAERPAGLRRGRRGVGGRHGGSPPGEAGRTQGDVRVRPVHSPSCPATPSRLRATRTEVPAGSCSSRPYAPLAPLGAVRLPVPHEVVPDDLGGRPPGGDFDDREAPAGVPGQEHR